MTVAMLLVALVASDAEISVDSLRAGLHQRQVTFPGLELVYKVRRKVGSHEEERSVDVFRIMPPLGPNDTSHWRCWERHVPERDGTKNLVELVAFNGSESRTYNRRAPGQGKWSTSGIVPFEEPDRYQYNFVDSLLYWDLNGIPTYMDPTGNVSRAIDNRFEIAGIEKQAGVDAYLLKGEHRGVLKKVHVQGPPDFLILRYQATEKATGEDYFLVEVTALGSIGDIRYPASGTFKQRAVKLLPEVSYEFVVSEALLLSDDRRASWFPEWPPGSIFNDAVSGPATPDDPSPARGRWLLAAVNVGVLALIGGYVVFRRRRRAGQRGS